MSYSNPCRARHVIALCFISVTLLLAGCNGGGSSSDSSSKTSDSTSNSGSSGSSAASEATVSSKLRWTAPATRADGSKLYVGEISGYRIYYKLKHQSGYRSIKVSGSDRTQYPLKAFEPGQYEFSVTTLDTDGLESQRSEVISVSVI
ncbi:fibronectin type III domain-containing protein [Marinobacter sp. JSM 1782161]|uniref:fibronectin type III domain-containing protein n=1 Tax=Marinobacter sp. JSM 1782161 TaxID=2685906 RepID=UPI001A9E9CCE|nr:fibronectin type III domain-containing protein [Marinobacter sp. JSM 1782161]